MEILQQLIINSIITGSIYALASSGLCLSFGIMRVLNFAHGHMMMISAYIFLWALQTQGFGYFGAALTCFAFAVVLGEFVLRFFVDPFSRYSFVLALVSTLALSNILEAVVSILFGVNVKSIPMESMSESLTLGSAYVTEFQIAIIGVAVLLLVTLGIIVHYTKLGRAVRAVSENAFIAQALGVSRKMAVRVVFISSSVLAAIAGVMVGVETNLTPTMGTHYTIKAIAAMLLGGLGNLWGTLIGCYILGAVENFSIGMDFFGYSLPAGYKDAFAYLIIFLVLLFKPEGLFVRRSRKI